MMPGDAHISRALMEQLQVAGLPESEAREVARHLEDCAECRCRKQILDFWGELSIGNNTPLSAPGDAESAQF